MDLMYPDCEPTELGEAGRRLSDTDSPLDQWVACEVCGCLNPLPPPELIVQGDYDAPPVYGYEEEWMTCCRCGQKAVRLQ